MPERKRRFRKILRSTKSLETHMSPLYLLNSVVSTLSTDEIRSVLVDNSYSEDILKDAETTLQSLSFPINSIPNCTFWAAEAGMLFRCLAACAVKENEADTIVRQYLLATCVRIIARWQGELDLDIGLGQDISFLVLFCVRLDLIAECDSFVLWLLNQDVSTRAGDPLSLNNWLLGAKSCLVLIQSMGALSFDSDSLLLWRSILSLTGDRLAQQAKG